VIALPVTVSPKFSFCPELPAAREEVLVSNSARRKTKVETPPKVTKNRRARRRPIEARLVPPSRSGFFEPLRAEYLRVIGAPCGSGFFRAVPRYALAVRVGTCLWNCIST
jgi:hypothetical protein